ncbi:type I methionyl aminopeptidase [Patescibacteria group bacterium]
MSLIKTAEEIALMREGGKLLAQAIAVVVEQVRPGVSTDELDQVFTETLRGLGAEPSFLGYKDYPKSLCTSLGDEVVHGIPGERVLRDGDIIGVDGGARYKGFCTDMARTIAVGEPSEEVAQLLKVTEEALDIGIGQMVPGNTLGDIGAAIQEHAETNGYSVVRALVGHGIGEGVHEEPAVPNFGKPGQDDKLEPGMVLCLEPMINIGKHDVVMEDDGWTVRTKDGTLSAHFEDTIVVTEGKPEILTRI